MIALHDVSISFDAQPILKSVNLTMEKGDSLVVIGPSGSGKSVLLKVMAGLIRPTKGRVTIEGTELLTLRGAEKKRLLQRMGMLFQKNALFDSLSVFENVAFPLRESTEKSESEIKERVEHFLEAVGILHAKDLFPDEISGGMQKRLGIARSLALSPEIIFYDDPTAGLDPITSRKIIQLILQLKEEHGSTIITVTNEMNRAYQLAGDIGMVVDQEFIRMGGREATESFRDPRVQQFIKGGLEGPLTTIA